MDLFREDALTPADGVITPDLCRESGLGRRKNEVLNEP